MAPTGTPPAATAAPARLPGESSVDAARRAPEVLAMVFDRLSADGRALAFDAAQQYIGNGKVSNNVVAVFGIDLSLIFHQTFTRDADAIRAAVRTAAGRATSGFGTQRQTASQSAEQLAKSNAALNNMAGSAGPAGSPADIGLRRGRRRQFATIPAPDGRDVPVARAQRSRATPRPTL